MSERSTNAKCHWLAMYFLANEAAGESRQLSHDDTNSLSAAIQTAVENWFVTARKTPLERQPWLALLPAVEE